MSVENDTEIYADKPTDIGGRLITTENLKRFKGLKGQTVYNKEDSYRPYIMDGENFGGKAIAFKDDFVVNNGSYTVQKIVTKSDNEVITLDVNNYCQFQLDLQHPQSTVEITPINNVETNIFKKINIYVRFITGSNIIAFPNNFYIENFDFLSQFDLSKLLDPSNAGDMAAFEAITLDSGALWFYKLLGYWRR